MDYIQLTAVKLRSLPQVQAAFVYWRITEDPSNRVKQKDMPAKILELTGVMVSEHMINNWNLWETLGPDYCKEKRNLRYATLKNEFETVIRVCEIKPEHFRTWPEGPMWYKLLPNSPKIPPTIQAEIKEILEEPTPIEARQKLVDDSERLPRYLTGTPIPSRKKRTDYSKVSVLIGEGEEVFPEDEKGKRLTSCLVVLGIIFVIYLVVNVLSEVSHPPVVYTYPNTIRDTPTPRITPYEAWQQRTPQVDFYCKGKGFEGGVETTDGWRCIGGGYLAQGDLDKICNFGYYNNEYYAVRAYKYNMVSTWVCVSKFKLPPTP